MFDEHARTLIEQLPGLPDLDHLACREMGSGANTEKVSREDQDESGGDHPVNMFSMQRKFHGSKC